MNNVRYRFDYAVHDDGFHVYLTEYKVVKKTNKGAFVNKAAIGLYFPEGTRFVLDGRGKRYCHETKELAWSYFINRKKSYLHRLTFRQEELSEVMKLLPKDCPPDDVNIGGVEFINDNYLFD